MPIGVSIVICTYNRSASLARTLESIARIKTPAESYWEIIVVDNNSTDSTQKTISGFQGRLPIRYVFESVQGLSNARNRGIREAQGDIITFTDDDVVVDGNWLVNINRAFQELDAACIGGKILPAWEAAPPSWLGRELYCYLALLDLGNERMIMQQPTLWGANLSFRASIFKKYGLFDTSLGRIGDKLYGDEEIRVLKKLIDNGEKVFYCPEVIVHHRIPANRLKKRYFRKWFFDAGELSGLLMGEYLKRNFKGIPLYTIKSFLWKAAFYLKCEVFGRQDRFLEQLKLLNQLGFMSGRMKYKKMNKTDV